MLCSRVGSLLAIILLTTAAAAKTPAKAIHVAGSLKLGMPLAEVQRQFGAPDAQARGGQATSLFYILPRSFAADLRAHPAVSPVSPDGQLIVGIRNGKIVAISIFGEGPQTSAFGVGSLRIGDGVAAMQARLGRPAWWNRPRDVAFYPASHLQIDIDPDTARIDGFLIADSAQDEHIDRFALDEHRNAGGKVDGVTAFTPH